jgi:hypothetical protein
MRPPVKPVTAFLIPLLILSGLQLILAATQGTTLNAINILTTIAGVGIMVFLLAALSSLWPWPLKDRIIALFLLYYFVQDLPSLIEYYFFSGGTTTYIIGGLGTGLVNAGFAAVLIAWIYRPDTESFRFGAALAGWFRQRGLFSWVWRLIAAMLAYLILYIVVGSIAFQFTEPYYTDPAYGLELTLPEGGLVLIAKIQPVRTIIFLMGLSGLLVGLGGNVRRVGLWTGAALFILGGLSPLLAGAYHWPAALRIYHVIEIFFQNVPAGYIFARLLAPATGNATHAEGTPRAVSDSSS